MAKFKLHDGVMKDGEWSFRTVLDTREAPGAEIQYLVQVGDDSATRMWAKESELEPEPKELPANKKERGKRIRNAGNFGKVKVVSGHKTAPRRRLKRANTKGRGRGKSIRLKQPS